MEIFLLFYENETVYWEWLTDIKIAPKNSLLKKTVLRTMYIICYLLWQTKLGGVEVGCGIYTAGWHERDTVEKRTG